MLDRTRAVPALTSVATLSSDQFGDFKEIKDPAVKSLVSTKLSPRPQQKVVYLESEDSEPEEDNTFTVKPHPDIPVNALTMKIAQGM